jgi:hypothetical protein
VFLSQQGKHSGLSSFAFSWRRRREARSNYQGLQASTNGCNPVCCEGQALKGLCILRGGRLFVALSSVSHSV